MSQPDEPISRDFIDQRFMMRLFYVVLAVALLSVAISIGGKWIGRTIVLAGHTEDLTPREIVIGNEVLSVASNAIRFEDARRDGVSERLDLYLHWPDMKGYTAATRDAFNNVDGRRSILFVTVEEASMSRDMTGRLAPIYRNLIAPDGKALANGLKAHAFTEKSGYRDEELVVGGGATPFVARCLTGKAAAESLAPCERDIRIGDELSLTYRFPRALLADADQLEAAVRRTAEAWLRTAD